MMEAVSTSEMLVNLYQTTQLNITEKTVIFILSEISGSHGGKYGDSLLSYCTM
jgi:hypothetical protein